MTEFKVGDEVGWVHRGGRGRQLIMHQVYGFIHEIKDDQARCRRGKKGKKDYWVPLKALKLREEGKGGQLMDFLEAMARPRQEPEKRT